MNQSKLEEFFASPSINKLDQFKKGDLVEFANALNVQVPTGIKKGELKQFLIKNLA